MNKEALILSFLFTLLLFHPSAATASDNYMIVLSDTLIYDEHKWKPGSGIIPPSFTDAGQNPSILIMRRLEDSKILKHSVINTVFDVALVFEKDGHISAVTPSKSAHPLVAKEVINLLKLMPRARPAVRQGKALRFRMYYKIAFKNTPG